MNFVLIRKPSLSTSHYLATTLLFPFQYEDPIYWMMELLMKKRELGLRGRNKVSALDQILVQTLR